MENTTYLDTHAVVWLFNNDLKRFPTRTLDLIGNSQLLISPMVILELEYLFEINRLNINANTLFDTLQEEIDLQTCPLDFLQVINSALEENWTRDPFDRIIVAQASLNKSMLVSKDEVIHKHYDKVFWL